jgi:hypothetical protein
MILEDESLRFMLYYLYNRILIEQNLSSVCFHIELWRHKKNFIISLNTSVHNCLAFSSITSSNCFLRNRQHIHKISYALSLSMLKWIMQQIKLSRGEKMSDIYYEQ